MIEQRAHIDEPDYLPHAVGLVARLSTAAAGGIGFGVVTLWMQNRFGGNWNVLANSGAVWTIVAVGLAAVLARSVRSTAAAGLLALVGEVAGYYWCAAPWNGIAVTHSEQVLWGVAAVVLGPIAGIVGHGLHASATRRVQSLLCVAGLTSGEGWYQMSITQHAVAGRVEVALGLVLAAVTLLSSKVATGTRAGALVLGCLVAGGVLLAYRAPTLVL